MNSNSKNILTIMNETISELNDKGTINEGQYIEGCRILKEAYVRDENNKDDFIKLDNPIKVSYDNSDSHSGYDLLFSIVGYIKEPNTNIQLVKYFICKLDNYNDFTHCIRIGRGTLQNFIKIKLSIIRHGLFKINSVYDEYIDIFELVKGVYQLKKTCYDVMDDEENFESDYIAEETLKKCRNIIYTLIELQFQELGIHM
jgi:hypothetical protein